MADRDNPTARAWRRSYGLPETYADLMAAAHADALRRATTGYAPDGYYDPITAPDGSVVDHDDPRPWRAAR